jgi:glycosyltransferase involved in cell wall biosynthesis
MISIVTPTMNAANVLGRNIAMMRDQRAKCEHIIQDGGSTDKTKQLVDSYASTYNLRFFQERDEGIYDAVAKGMEKAEGEIFGWLGADDHYLPWTLSSVQELFAERPEIDWIIGIPALGFNDCRQVWIPPLAPVYLREAIRRGYYRPGLLGTISQEAMFWRRSLWERCDAGQLIRRYRYAGDYHLWKAFSIHAKLFSVCTPLAVFSVSNEQTSGKHLASYIKEIDPNETRFRRTPSFAGALFNKVISLVLNSSVVRPGFDFAKVDIHGA